MENALRQVVWTAAGPVEDPSTPVSRGADDRATAQLFARATARRGRYALTGAALALMIGALYATGGWMTLDVARALGAQERGRLEEPRPAAEEGGAPSSRATARSIARAAPPHAR